jgi:hypothetical protein
LVAVHVVMGLVGAWVVAATAVSALQTMAVPAAVPMLITRWVFVLVRFPFTLAISRTRDYRKRDRAMSLYAPLGLVTLPAAWLLLVLTGFMLIFWSLGVRPMRNAFVESGSSLLTLGFRAPVSLPTTAVAFIEAALGLGLVALLISYLPAIYGSYSRRELLVTALETQAGSPPSAAEMLERLARIGGLEAMADTWREWTRWFGDIEETHTTAPSLVFFRSPQPDRSWVTAAGAVLDAASILQSSIDIPRQPDAALCVRAGYLCLRRVADYFAMPYDRAPAPDDPISIRREEFDEVLDRLAVAGAPLRPDRDQAWRDFAGWRVNYDSVLLRFASLVAAPEAPWSSDRPITFHRAPLAVRRARVSR